MAEIKNVWIVVSRDPSSLQVIDSHVYDNKDQALNDARESVASDVPTDVIHNGRVVAYGVYDPDTGEPNLDIDQEEMDLSEKV